MGRGLTQASLAKGQSVSIAYLIANSQPHPPPSPSTRHMLGSKTRAKQRILRDPQAHPPRLTFAVHRPGSVLVARRTSAHPGVYQRLQGLLCRLVSVASAPPWRAAAPIGRRWTWHNSAASCAYHSPRREATRCAPLHDCRWSVTSSGDSTLLLVVSAPSVHGGQCVRWAALPCAVSCDVVSLKSLVTCEQSTTQGLRA